MPPTDTSWHAEALCVGVLNFTELAHDVREPYCSACPVQVACEASDPWPWWGAKPITEKAAGRVRRPGALPAKTEEIMMLVESGETFERVAERLGMQVESVRGLLRRHGLGALVARRAYEERTAKAALEGAVA